MDSLFQGDSGFSAPYIAAQICTDILCIYTYFISILTLFSVLYVFVYIHVN